MLKKTKLKIELCKKFLLIFITVLLFPCNYAFAATGLFATAGATVNATSNTVYNTQPIAGNYYYIWVAAGGTIIGGDNISIIYDHTLLNPPPTTVSSDGAIRIASTITRTGSVTLGNNATIRINEGPLGINKTNYGIRTDGVATNYAHLTIGNNANISSDEYVYATIYSRFSNVIIGSNALISSEADFNLLPTMNKTAHGFAINANTTNLALGVDSVVKGTYAMHLNKGDFSFNKLTIDAKTIGISFSAGTDVVGEIDTDIKLVDSTINLTGTSTSNFNNINGLMFRITTSGGGGHIIGSSGSVQKGVLHIINSTLNNLGDSSNAIFSTSFTDLVPRSREHNAYIKLDDTTVNAKGAKFFITDPDFTSDLSTIALEMNNSTALNTGGIHNNANGLLDISLSDSVLEGSANNIGSGTLKLNVNNNSSFTGDIVGSNLAKTDISVVNNSVWNGSGSRYTNATLSKGTWNLNKSSSIASLNISSDSYINFTDNSKTSTLTVAGDYNVAQGAVARVIINADLENLTANKLVINGNASGETILTVVRVADNGALTVGNGIEIVRVKGTNAGTFTLSSAISGGIYDYWVNQVGNTYYLANNFGGVPILNTTVGAAIANQQIAGTMFKQNVVHNNGIIRENKSGEPSHSIWSKISYSDMKSDILSGTQNVHAKTVAIQLGSDLYKNDTVLVGIYGGYGNADTDIKSHQNNKTSGGKVTGVNFGAYTSLTPPQVENLYMDLWSYYAWFDNEFKDYREKNKNTYRSTAYSIATEIGYGIEFFENKDRKWLVEPNFQIAYTRVNNNSFKNEKGMRFDDTNNHGIQTKLGTKIYSKLTNNKNGVLPYAELNWLHNSIDYKTEIDQNRFESNVGKNVFEAKLGLDGQLSENISLGANVGYQTGSNSFSQIQTEFGLKYQW